MLVPDVKGRQTTLALCSTRARTYILVSINSQTCFLHFFLVETEHSVQRHLAHFKSFKSAGLPDLLANGPVPRTSGAGGVALSLGCSTWRRLSVSMETAGCSAGTSAVLGGWSWQRQSQSQEALKGPGKSFQCNCRDRNEKCY